MNVAAITVCAVLLYVWGERNRKRAADKEKENELLTRAVAQMLTDQSVVDLSRIDVLNLQPDDIVAIRTHRPLTREQAEQVKQQAISVLGERPILILPPDFELMVVRYPLDEPE